MVTYTGLNQTTLRGLLSKVILEMSSRGMKISGNFILCSYPWKSVVDKYSLLIVNTCTLGFTANGEFNVFRSTGYSRPLLVLKIRADARAKYAKMALKKDDRDDLSSKSVNT